MNTTSKTLLMAAAIAGLVSGAAIQQTRGDSATNTTAGKATPEKKSPSVHGCAGQNDCKALGGCKSGDNGCKYKNSCKGKGGCELTQKDIDAYQKK